MTFRKQLFIPNKRDYITGKNQPEVECILCAILEGHPEITSLLVWKNDLVAVCANLYPYNAGHLLIFPIRHIEDPRELTENELLSVHNSMKSSLDKLESLYFPQGFNIGYNVGEASGASIPHLHQHVIPRYPRELGFVDITSGSKIIIEDPNITLKKLQRAFNDEEE